MADRAFVSAPSSDSQRKKKLQADEATRPLERVGVRIDDIQRSTFARHVVRCHTARAIQDVGLTRQEDSSRHWYREPFVRIERDRIGPLDAIQERSELWDQHGRSTPSRVRMQPDTLTAGDLAQLFDRIYHSGARGAGCSDDHEWQQTGKPVSTNAVDENLRINLQVRVDRNVASGVGSQPTESRRFHERVMTL